EWRSFIAAGCQTGGGHEKVQVLLRASTPGQEWFQQVRVQPLAVRNLSSNCSEEALSIQK
ncbi:MAG TPA: hypothetical protein VJ508_16535, partial [Saprospiraceae bacterium]|nr:hypothetical protein [Saprospiraceae bacterium]